MTHHDVKSLARDVLRHRIIVSYEADAEGLGADDILGRILDQVEAAKGLFSINHPGLPSGEACMGCGWTTPATDDRGLPASLPTSGTRHVGVLGPC